MANVAMTGGARLEGAYDNVDRTVYTTSAFTPSTGNHLVTMAVFGWHGSALTVPEATVAGGGVTTWTEETAARQWFDSNRGRLFLFRALESSYGASATATITFPAVTIAGCGWWVCEWENMLTTGTNGADAVRQVVPAAVTASTSCSTTLAALASSESVAAALGVAIGTSRTTTVGSGYTSSMNFGNQSSPDCALRGEHKLNDTAPSFTITGGAADAAIVGFEIAAAAGAATPKPKSFGMMGVSG
jgi:hypothetical protein